MQAVQHLIQQQLGVHTFILIRSILEPHRTHPRGCRRSKPCLCATMQVSFAVPTARFAVWSIALRRFSGPFELGCFGGRQDRDLERVLVEWFAELRADDCSQSGKPSYLDRYSGELKSQEEQKGSLFPIPASPFCQPTPRRDAH